MKSQDIPAKVPSKNEEKKLADKIRTSGCIQEIFEC